MYSQCDLLQMWSIFSCAQSCITDFHAMRAPTQFEKKNRLFTVSVRVLGRCKILVSWLQMVYRESIRQEVFPRFFTVLDRCTVYGGCCGYTFVVKMVYTSHWLESTVTFATRASAGVTITSGMCCKILLSSLGGRKIVLRRFRQNHCRHQPSRPYYLTAAPGFVILWYFTPESNVGLTHTG